MLSLIYIVVTFCKELELRIHSLFLNFQLFVNPVRSDWGIIKASASNQREPSWFTFTPKATEQKIPHRQNFAVKYNTQSQFHVSASWYSERPIERKQPWILRFTLCTCEGLPVFTFGAQHLKFLNFLTKHVLSTNYSEKDWARLIVTLDMP
jgi:hypothetical protein